MEGKEEEEKKEEEKKSNFQKHRVKLVLKKDFLCATALSIWTQIFLLQAEKLTGILIPLFSVMNSTFFKAEGSRDFQNRIVLTSREER